MQQSTTSALHGCMPVLHACTAVIAAFHTRNSAQTVYLGDSTLG
jgi:hypothetical protein